MTCTFVSTTYKRKEHASLTKLNTKNYFSHSDRAKAIMQVFPAIERILSASQLTKTNNYKLCLLEQRSPHFLIFLSGRT